jgi:hypothetical protein
MWVVLFTHNNGFYRPVVALTFGLDHALVGIERRGGGLWSGESVQSVGRGRVRRIALAAEFSRYQHGGPLDQRPHGVAAYSRRVRRAIGIARRPRLIVRNKRAPGLHRGLLFIRQDSAYRLTWRLVPPPGAPLPRSPPETTLTQSASLSLKYEVALAVRSAARLS